MRPRPWAPVGGRRLGSLSDFTCFSFHPRKIMTTGEGGVITTDDDAAADRSGRLRSHAASVSMLARHTTRCGPRRVPGTRLQLQLTDIQAAIGIVQMGRLDDILAERRRLAGRYSELLAGEDRMELPFEPDGYVHVYQSYCVRLRARIRKSRSWGRWRPARSHRGESLPSISSRSSARACPASLFPRRRRSRRDPAPAAVRRPDRRRAGARCRGPVDAWTCSTVPTVRPSTWRRRSGGPTSADGSPGAIASRCRRLVGRP